MLEGGGEGAAVAGIATVVIMPLRTAKLLPVVEVVMNIMS